MRNNFGQNRVKSTSKFRNDNETHQKRSHVNHHTPETASQTSYLQLCLIDILNLFVIALTEIEFPHKENSWHFFLRFVLLMMIVFHFVPDRIHSFFISEMSKTILATFIEFI